MQATNIGIDAGSDDGDMLGLKFEGGADFEAFYKAEQWCRDNDVAVGSMERDYPIGLMWGAELHEIRKWTRMTRREQKKLDGQLTGSKRSGPIFIHIKRRAS